MTSTSLNLSLSSLMEFSENEDGTELPLKVKGKSMHSGYIANKHVILPRSELDNVVNTLKAGIDGHGAYILKDHGFKGGLFSPKSVDLVVGRITNAWKENDNVVMYEGRIEDADLANKIRKNLVSATSIGMKISNLNCSICGRDYSDEKCMHRLGETYPDEGLHDIANEYLDEMGGKPIAAIFATGIIALEQSVVLFPAIEGSNISEKPHFSFSDDANSYIEQIEAKKLQNVETFNKENDDILLGKTMTNENFDFEAITGQMADLKADNKLLNANVMTLKTEKELLESKVTVKDTEISTLTASLTAKETELTAKNTEISTLKGLNTKYVAKETARAEVERTDMVNSLVALRKEKGLSDKDYTDVSIELLKSDHELIVEFKADNIPAGSVGDDDDPANDDKKILEAKEDIREMIFKSRKDGKELKNIRAEKDLTNRLN